MKYGARSGISLGLITALTLTLAMDAQAGKKKRKKAEPAKPAQVSFENTCDAGLDLTLGETSVKLEAKGKAAAMSIPTKADMPVQDLKVAAGEKPLLARLAILGGQEYMVTLHDCRNGLAEVTSQWTNAEKPASPHASAQVRFRARARRYLEVMQANKGRFKPLSVAHTKYEDVTPGDFGYGVRLRAARKGPVVANVKKSAKVEAGKRYLIEIDVVGQDLLFTVEDEGPVKD